VKNHTILKSFVSIEDVYYNSRMENEIQEAPPMAAPQPPLEKEESLWELVRFAIIVLLIALGLRFYVAQPFVVSGSSMVPTFQDKNYLIIDELSYDFHTPARGDVIVFHPPGQPAGIYYIKRVIGLPGETIKMANGVVTIINKENPNGFVLSEPYISAPTAGAETQVIPADNYFVMGDNRPYSSDSRVWGLLPRKNIVGHVLFRLFPFSEVSVVPGAYNQYQTK
jgi:signal peptidase I